ncbi:hypothetical protein F4814DRAFT_414695 [Daldinia grandis]|nr:hypothetical protein F4814DRAFT_414695 [Daldinia grandis]
MKLTTTPLFTALALIAYLPSILAVERLAANQGSVAVLSYGVANNGTAAGNGAEVVSPDQGEDNKDDAGDDDQNNGDKNNNSDEEESADDQQNADEENKNQDSDEKDNQDNDKGNLQQNIGNLMLSLGVCDFSIGSISGISLGSQIQLLLQLQQLAQLQQLGLVNSFSIEQLIRQEILLDNFNLKIIKRTVSASVKQAGRENKRTIVARKECRNKNNGN